MSIKHIHLAIVTFSCLLAIAMAGYALINVSGTMRFVWAAVALAAAVGIVVYGVRFRRKMQDAAYS